MVAKMESNVCDCFNSLEVDAKRVDMLIADATTGPKSKTARKELRAIYSDMKVEGAKTKGAKGAVYAIRESMDNAFVQHLGASSKAGAVFANQTSFRWTHAMSDYFKDLIKELPNVVATIGTIDVSTSAEQQVALESLKWCIAKIKVLLWVSGNPKKGGTASTLPFMSRSVYTHMVNRLKVIDGSLKEVSHADSDHCMTRI